MPTQEEIDAKLDEAKAEIEKNKQLMKDLESLLAVWEGEYQKAIDIQEIEVSEDDDAV